MCVFWSVFVALVFGFGCADGAGADVNLPEHVVVFSPADIAGDDFAPDSTWTPSTDDALAAEALIEQRLDHEIAAKDRGQPLSAYYRQYTGIDDDTVLANGACRSTDTEGWDERWIMVLDGGECYWTAEIVDGEIALFVFNGHA